MVVHYFYKGKFNFLHIHSMAYHRLVQLASIFFTSDRPTMAKSFMVIYLHSVSFLTFSLKLGSVLILPDMIICVSSIFLGRRVSPNLILFIFLKFTSAAVIIVVVVVVIDVFVGGGVFVFVFVIVCISFIICVNLVIVLLVV